MQSTRKLYEHSREQGLGSVTLEPLYPGTMICRTCKVQPLCEVTRQVEPFDMCYACRNLFRQCTYCDAVVSLGAFGLYGIPVEHPACCVPCWNRWHQQQAPQRTFQVRDWQEQGYLKDRSPADCSQAVAEQLSLELLQDYEWRRQALHARENNSAGTGESI